MPAIHDLCDETQVCKVSNSRQNLKLLNPRVPKMVVTSTYNSEMSSKISKLLMAP